MTEEANEQAVSMELTEFEPVRVRMILAVMDLQAGDVVEVPDKLAELWSTARIAIVVEADTATTAQLSNKDLTKISCGLDVS